MELKSLFRKRRIASDIFKSCLVYSSTFDEKNPKEYPDIDKFYLGVDYEGRKFSALLICCSIIYLKDRLLNNLPECALKDKFYSEFIELIIIEAKKIKSEAMGQDLNLQYDYEIGFIEEYSHENLILESMHFMSRQIEDYLNSFGVIMPIELAGIYYVFPGTMQYFHWRRDDRFADAFNSEKLTNDFAEHVEKIFFEISN